MLHEYFDFSALYLHILLHKFRNVDTRMRFHLGKSAIAFFTCMVALVEKAKLTCRDTIWFFLCIFFK